MTDRGFHKGPESRLNMLVLEPLFKEQRVLRSEYGGWLLPIQFLIDENHIAGSGISDGYYAGRDEAVGHITTFVVGATTGPCLAMGFVQEPWCKPGSRVEVNGEPATMASMKGSLDRSMHREGWRGGTDAAS